MLRNFVFRFEINLFEYFSLEDETKIKLSFFNQGNDSWPRETLFLYNQNRQ